MERNKDIPKKNKTKKRKLQKQELENITGGIVGHKGGFGRGGFNARS